MPEDQPTLTNDAPGSGTPYAERQLANVAAVLRLDERPTQIGPYRIIETLGEGGMGTVYRAEQRTPIYREVAIKVIKLGLDSRFVLARFDAERNALAVLDHPNVSRVLDAGTTGSGRPYFVMEFVAGLAITEYADAHRCTIHERLQLIQQACAAVQHAHQKAIIHRDIKPSNILVTTRDGIPVVKVIDFGVAKAIDTVSGDRTLFTEVGQMVGTPEYMSPEQADGKRDIDTRSDVYSLGVVMYELLSGTLPFDSETLRSAGYGEACRIIREVDPVRPSARLSVRGDATTVIAERRQSSPALLAEQLRSELDWIVIKAIRKERDARYSSPQELSEDIDNYLNNRPLRAGPETVVYRARKFIRRNRSAVIAAAAALVLLVGGVGATSWQAFRATRAERATKLEQSRTLSEMKRAEAASLATTTVNGFLTDMLKSVDPEIAQGTPVRVIDLIDRAAATVGERLKDQPRVEAEIRSTLGATYSGLGAYDKSQEHLAAALKLYQALDGVDSREALRAEQRLATLRTAQDRLDEAFTAMSSVLDRSRAKFGSDDELTIDVIVELGVLCDHRGDVEKAEKLLNEAIATYKRLNKTNVDGYFGVVGDLGSMLRMNNRVEEAEPLLKAAYDGMVRLKGANDPTTISMQGVYGDVLRLEGRLDEAEPIMRDFLARSLAVFGPDHVASIDAEQGLAIVLEMEGKSDEALTLFRDALAHVRKVMGDDHRETLTQITSLAAQRFRHGDYAEAGQLFREAHERLGRTVGPNHPNTIIALFGVVQTCYPTNSWADALAPAKELFDRLQDPQAVQIPPARRARYLSAYGVVLDHLGRADEAIGPLMVAYNAMLPLDMRPKGYIEAYSSVVRSLEHIAELKGEAAKAAYWHNELARFGEILPLSTPPTSAPTSTR